MSKHSLRRSIILSVVAACTVLVLGYSLLLQFYLKHGLHMDTEFRLRAEAQLYLEQYANNPDVPLPKTATITAYLGFDALPDEIRTLCSPQDLISGQFHQVERKQFLYYMYTVRRPDGQPAYFVFHLHKDKKPTEARQYFFTFFLYIPLAIGIGTTLIVVLLSVYMLKRIARPVERLHDWATHLDMDGLDNDTTDFTYAELNHLADLFRGNLRRLYAGAERERKFQQYASHELRTPIAILKNNLELMDRLGIHEHNRFESSYGRMEKAVRKMQHLTNTLLWACREDGTRLESEPLALNSLMQGLIEENTYLLEGKDIKIDSRLNPVRVQAARPVAVIILGNLVRNAFQHTTRGTITMACGEQGVSIENDKPTVPDYDRRENFGLGLQIARQLARRMGWDLRTEDMGSTFAARITFSATQTDAPEAMEDAAS